MKAGLPTDPAARVAIILVNWNGARDLLECLESLMRLNTPAFDVVVCDNQSSDGSVEKLVAWAAGGVPVTPESPAHAALFEAPRRVQPRVRVIERAEAEDGALSFAQDTAITIIRTGGNLGFAGGNNVGLRHAMRDPRYAHFWLLNTDTVVAADALDALLERAAQRPDAGMVGSTLLYYWFPDRVQAMGGASFDVSRGVAAHLGAGVPRGAIPADPAALEACTDYVVGASILASRAFVERVGLMCEDYFLYFEEIDWAVRGREGFALAYAPASVVFHKVGGSSRRQASRTSLRYLYRNRLRFMGRFFPASQGKVRRSMWLQLLQHARHRHWNDVSEIWAALTAQGEP